MMRTDRRDATTTSGDPTAQQARHSTLPPPVWASPALASLRPATAVVLPLARQAGARADEAWLRARVAEAQANGGPEVLRPACGALARWLAARERGLNEAAELAVQIIWMAPDVSLRRELSAWLE